MDFIDITLMQLSEYPWEKAIFKAIYKSVGETDNFITMSMKTLPYITPAPDPVRGPTQTQVVQAALVGGPGARGGCEGVAVELPVFNARHHRPQGSGGAVVSICGVCSF